MELIKNSTPQGKNDIQIKFGHSEKDTKFETIFHLIGHLLSKCQINWKIVSNFMAFLETNTVFPQIFSSLE